MDCINCCLQTFKSILLGATVIAALACSCQAQDIQSEPEGDLIATKKVSRRVIGEKHHVTLPTLPAWNPHIKNDVVSKNDTGFLAARNVTAQADIQPSVGLKPIGRSGLFKAVTYHGKRFLLCEVNPQHYQIEAYNQQEGERGAHSFSSLTALKKSKLLFVMNGGMFEPDFNPVGLLVANGKTCNKVNLRRDGHGNFYDLPLNKDTYPNGIFLIDSADNAYIVPSDHYAPLKGRTQMATQSGPILVLKGIVNENFKAGSPNVQIRNAVGVGKDGKVQLVISLEPVNFYDFSTLFRDELHCENALYLDGFVSQYYAPELQGAPQQAQPLGVYLAVCRSKNVPAPARKMQTHSTPKDKEAQLDRQSRKLPRR
jgi:uncharacterized protein YigE (DUF2233 family)